jgi:uncharacterized membrane protein
VSGEFHLFFYFGTTNVTIVSSTPMKQAMAIKPAMTM